MGLSRGYMIGDYLVVSDDALPPGMVWAAHMPSLKRKLGLWPYSPGPRFTPEIDVTRYRPRKPHTDDMVQMLEDLADA